MPRGLRAHAVGLLALLLAGSELPAQQHEIVLATTTSTQDTGLLDSLLPMFQRETGIAVKPIAVGTGAALEMARRGDADAVLVHAPEAERTYVQAGDIIDGRRIMYNDFLIIGPAGDPAGVKGKPLVQAMKAIAGGGSFVSRGDGSGTESKELALWKAAGVAPAAIAKREETGQGMGATLSVADQKRAYTLTDRGTYLSLRQRLTLVVLFQGDPRLRNEYHVYAVSRAKHPRVKHREARAFIDFLVSPSVQRAIAAFKRDQYGESLFFPDAVPVRP